ncbi:hypothetical protein [Actinophytocola sp.]|uniref:hypothetical protein n=1 Tax=Actinophytocola sp. TaxID=1872138 RepID=UPI003D6AE37F
MQVAARAGRFGLLLALLLVLFGVPAAVTPGTGVGTGNAVRHQALPQWTSTIGGSASAAPSMHDDLQDWLRLSTGTLRSLATALSDTWWAVCPRATDACAPRGRLLIGEVGGTGMAAATPTPRSSRAPPFA